ncbi:MAG TPA: hypothetical protein VI485_07465 [Vicinamibacterales bacterium]|nr:hypothetical protein [Vicinamibacterales bacterium]
MPTGEDYPSYQVYLALSWLRAVDVIRKRDRAGYPLVKGTDVAKIDGLWTALPAPEEQQGQESSRLA